MMMSRDNSNNNDDDRHGVHVCSSISELLQERSFFHLESDERQRIPLADERSLLHLRSARKKLLMIMIGLPARGKTATAFKLVRYMSWLSYKSRVFNIGQYRRSMVGAKMPANWFDPSNAVGVDSRRMCALAALSDIFHFFEKESGQVALLDGTNSTQSRRDLILQVIAERKSAVDIEVVWIEMICNDSELVQQSIRQHKLKCPDYEGLSDELAFADFSQRIAVYETAYEHVTDEHAYVKIIDAGRKVVANLVQGYLPSRIVSFLLNLNVHKYPIYFSRHGESVNNLFERVGGDAELTKAGEQYAVALSEFIQSETPVKKRGLAVWCSTLKRTIQTAAEVPGIKPVQWSALVEIQAGVCDGLTYDEIRERYPQEYDARMRDKLAYRYPQGESYLDVIRRLESVIIELERARGPVLVIAHRAVLRCLISYYRDYAQEDIPHVDIPLHTVIKVSPGAYCCEEERFFLGPEIESHE